ncbi:MAG: UDP-N-acetylmuramoyl-L-alanyl-D-glutamate--2,6-diaminopimelate ligase [Candidatus Omnitrophota bacterium]
MKNLKIIGITGTNGKTTTAFLIYHLLKKMGQKTSLIGTIKYIIGSKVYKAKLTTPSFIDLRKILKKIKDTNSNFVVMEVSSHGLVQGRVKDLKFSRCLFTNLSRDHLDYHKTISNYFKAKEKLFFTEGNPLAIVNIDDQYGKKIFKGVKQGLSFGIKTPADFNAKDIVLSKRGSCFKLVSSGRSYLIKTRLTGRHNILNILGAAGLVFSLGFSLSKIVKAASSFRPVTGRLEPVARDIFVDYAHTPDALDRVLRSLRQVGYEKIICLFGCGGDRDRGKRRIMGQIASLKADFTFITSDNPRSESPLQICAQIKRGFSKDNYLVISDRHRAIKEAIRFFLSGKLSEAAGKRIHSAGFWPSRTSEGKACLLIAGKGHEDYQIIKDKKIPFNDKQIVKKILRSQR